MCNKKNFQEFQDYKNCLEYAQIERELKYLENKRNWRKIKKEDQRILKKIKKNS